MTSARSTPGQGRSTTWMIDDSHRPRIDPTSILRASTSCPISRLLPSVPTTTTSTAFGDRSVTRRGRTAATRNTSAWRSAGGPAHAGEVARVDDDGSGGPVRGDARRPAVRARTRRSARRRQPEPLTARPASCADGQDEVRGRLRPAGHDIAWVTPREASSSPPVERLRLAVAVQPNPLNGEAPGLEPQVSALVRLIPVEPAPVRPLSVDERPLFDARGSRQPRASDPAGANVTVTPVPANRNSSGPMATTSPPAGRGAAVGGAGVAPPAPPSARLGGTCRS